MFRDRQEAAERLSCQLQFRSLHDPLVLGMTRGGLVLGAVLARELGADLDVLLARKLRAPNQPERALGAIGEDDSVVLDPMVRDWPDGIRAYLEVEKRFQAATLNRRKHMLRSGRPMAPVTQRSVIVADDGLATGPTLLAGLSVLVHQQLRELIVALPVCSAERIAAVRRHCDDLVCLVCPEGFFAISQFYRDFHEVTDEEVRELLRHDPLPRHGPGQMSMA